MIPVWYENNANFIRPHKCGGRMGKGSDGPSLPLIKYRFSNLLIKNNTIFGVHKIPIYFLHEEQDLGSLKYCI